MDFLTELYTRKNSPYFPATMYMCIIIAKNELMRELRFVHICM